MYINEVEPFLFQNNFQCLPNNPLQKFVTNTKIYIKTGMDISTSYGEILRELRHIYKSNS